MTAAAPASVPPPPSSDEPVSERLARALRESEMTQVELARQLAGVGATDARVESTRRLVLKWLSGAHQPSSRHTARLAEILGVPASHFDATGSMSAVDDDAIDLMWDAVTTNPQKSGKLPPSFGRDTIAQDLAPHFEPSHILLDWVETYEPLQSATAFAAFTPQTLKLGRWYRDADMIPGLVLLEALAQTASVALLTHETYRGRIVLCAGYDGVRIKKVVQPREKLRLTARLQHISRERIAHYSAEARRFDSNELVARGSFVLAVH
jgi:3-hydroxyacyl-[acyl-carrier-protein] dehydratase